MANLASNKIDLNVVFLKSGFINQGTAGLIFSNKNISIQFAEIVGVFHYPSYPLASIILLINYIVYTLVIIKRLGENINNEFLNATLSTVHKLSIG